MATTPTRLSLTKPDYTDNVDIAFYDGDTDVDQVDVVDMEEDY